MPVDSTLPYDPGNIFARILRGEIPSEVVMEDEHTRVLHDISPQAPTHLLVIPKGAYVAWDDFSAHASDAEIASFTRMIGAAARAAGVEASGYRLIVNNGLHSGQEVPHLHAHILGGTPIGPLVMR